MGGAADLLQTALRLAWELLGSVAVGACVGGLHLRERLWAPTLVPPKDLLMALFGLMPDSTDSTPLPPASMATPAGRFGAQCLRWARGHGQLHTRLLPGNALPSDGLERARFDGHTATPTRAPELAYGGFVALVVCWLVLVIADRVRPGAAADAALHLAGVVLGALGSLALAAAWLVYRRARTPVVAVVDTGEDPVSEPELRALQERSRGTRLWVFSQRGFEGSAAAFALMAGIRCLTPAGAAFVDAGAQAASAAPTVARAPKERRAAREPEV